MNKAMLTVGAIFLALIAIVLVNLLVNTTTSSELDYYLLKETTNAAMEDAVDLGYYHETGQLRMDTEKFVENFLVRFANSVDSTRYYKVGFYDINETPPKASVKIDSLSAASFNDESTELIETYNGIIETDSLNNIWLEEKLKKPSNE